MNFRINDILALDDLPSLPEVAHRVLMLARDRDTDVSDLADAVKADPAMSAKVLKTANSALFGRQFKINTVQAAIPVLGSTLLRTLVLGFSLTCEEKWKSLEVSYRMIWRRAILQAAAAEQLAMQLPNEDPSFYFVCGLVQDTGSLAILGANAEQYDQTVLSKSSVGSLAQAEQVSYGYSHVDVSVGLCEKWQLAPAAIEAVAEHHKPLNLLRSGPDRVSHLTEALKLASLCAHYVEAESHQFTAEFLGSLSRVFNINRRDAGDFLAQLQGRVGDLTANFCCDADGLPPLEDIMGKAKSAIEEVAIHGQLEASKATRHRRRLEQENSQDPLTGVGNRRALEAGIVAMIQTCVEWEEPLGILFFDIDNFKSHNDLLGHDAGDEALKTFVNVLASKIRSQDLIVRYGGDEFIAICAGPSFQALNAIAERTCREFEARFPPDPQKPSLSTSVGGIHCSYESLMHLDPTTAIAEADKKMYDAKRRGGNQWSIDTYRPSHASYARETSLTEAVVMGIASGNPD